MASKKYNIKHFMDDIYLRIDIYGMVVLDIDHPAVRKKINQMEKERQR